MKMLRCGRRILILPVPSVVVLLVWAGGVRGARCFSVVALFCTRHHGSYCCTTTTTTRIMTNSASRFSSASSPLLLLPCWNNIKSITDETLTIRKKHATSSSGRRSQFLQTTTRRISYNDDGDGGDDGYGYHSSSADELQDEDFFLRQVEITARNVLSAHNMKLVLVTNKNNNDNNNNNKDDILLLPCQDREAVGIARHLETRLQSLRRNNDCPRCWMQRAHCICSQCPPVSINIYNNNNNNDSIIISHEEEEEEQRPIIRRIFLILHHKEVALKVDTAKLILGAFPKESRLIVGGIGPEYQASMKELMDAVDQRPDQCLVLFPDETARTYEELLLEQEVGNNVGAMAAENDDINSGTTTSTTSTSSPDDDDSSDGWDLVVLDGTWAQARKFHQRYFPEPSNGGPRRVQLSAEALAELGGEESSNGGENVVEGHQLRRHSIAWRQIGTFEATRLFLRDVGLAHSCDHNNSNNNKGNENNIPVWSKIKSYQEIANRAAQRELGPPRVAGK